MRTLLPRPLLGLSPVKSVTRRRPGCLPPSPHFSHGQFSADPSWKPGRILGQLVLLPCACGPPSPHLIRHPSPVARDPSWKPGPHRGQFRHHLARVLHGDRAASSISYILVSSRPARAPISSILYHQSVDPSETSFVASLFDTCLIVNTAGWFLPPAPRPRCVPLVDLRPVVSELRSSLTDLASP